MAGRRERKGKRKRKGKGKRKEKGVKDRPQCATNVRVWAPPAQLLEPLAATEGGQALESARALPALLHVVPAELPTAELFLNIYIILILPYMVPAVSKAVPGRQSVYVLQQAGCSTGHIITVFDVHTNLPSFICSLPTRYRNYISQHHTKERKCTEMKFNGFH